MMKRTSLLALTALLLMTFGLMMAGCSNSDNSTGPINVGLSVTQKVTTPGTPGQVWRTQVDATSYDEFTGYSFASQEAVVLDSSNSGATWDLAFQRYIGKLNGGISAENGGDAAGVDLGVVNFDSVTIDDTAGVTWQADAASFQIDEWYDYNPTTHQLTVNRNVYSMVDAGGHNYLKFQVDSLVGAGMPPDMGTVYIRYFYQATADSRDLTGSTVEVAVPVGANKTYFDFSSGSAVTPADPAHATDWDIFFNNYEIGQNCGINGSGACGVYDAYADLVDSLHTDPSNIDAWTTQPAGAPLFQDEAGSILSNWWSYNHVNNRLSSYEHVYLIKTEGMVYKLIINSYYGDATGSPTSGWIDFTWSQL